MSDKRMREAAASRRALLLGLAALAAAPLAACKKEPGVTADVPPLLVADGVQRRQPPADAPVGASADGLRAFGHRFFEAAAQPGANFVMSPLSLAVAFAMLRVGTEGQSAKELDTVFGFPASGRDAAFNALTRELVTEEVPPEPDMRPRKPNEPKRPPVVTIGNALFVQKSYPIGKPFLQTLAADYAAGVRPVDFTTDALKHINAWGVDQTAGRIKEVFQELEKDTKVVLANAVYFKADWKQFFAQMVERPFTKAGGQVIQSQMMTRIDKLRYAEVNGVKAIELSYAGGPYAMWLMLAPPDRHPEEALQPAITGKLGTAFTETLAEITMPRWNFATDLDLTKVMPGMGLPTVFTTSSDFSGIARGLFIDKAIHKANITVDEWGSEAAAVTAIGMRESAPPEPAVRFVADRPFAFAIVGGKDHTPLFLGRVSDPAAK